ncbi:hypothetical protein [Macrococcus brunensis]|uniref:hypothetical protein n=1 Tax=Macrococcus brunensis TaxID=198483 RepID=UPI001EEF9F7B|nr:hypothetical protein [Macrococcus brunensis]ULG73233.1 hypothetical protein MGG13_05765 [Macrococcus brunensis]
MNKFKINRYGEINLFSNSIEYVSPLENFKDIHTNKEKLMEDYQAFSNDFKHNNVFCQITRFNDWGKYISFDYFLQDATMYAAIRNYDFMTQLNLFSSLTDVAEFQEQHQVRVLWDFNNFVIAHHKDDKDRVKAVLHNFGDLVVYDDTTPLNGLKRLIILGLTQLKSGDVKPLKADFIHQDDDVFQFADEVLRAKDIQSIRRSIDTRLGQVKEMGTVPVKKEKNKSPNKSPLRYILMGLAALLLIMAVFFVFHNMSQKSKESEALNQQLKQQQRVNDIFSEYISGDRQQAKKKMSTLNYDDLNSDKQRSIYIKWLVEEEQYDKALSLDKEAAYLIGQDIHKSNQSAITDLAKEKDSDVLKFFVASKEGRYDDVVKLSDKIDLKERSAANELVKAYLLTDQSQKLKEVINKSQKDSQEAENLTTVQKYYQPYEQSLKDATNHYDDKRKEIKALKETLKKKSSNAKAKKQLTQARKELKSIKNNLVEVKAKIADIDVEDIH